MSVPVIEELAPVTVAIRPVESHNRWRDPLTFLSFANLCYCPVWAGLLAYRDPVAQYTAKAPPPPAAYLAYIGNVLLLGGVLWSGGTAMKHVPARYRPLLTAAANVAFLLLLALGLNNIFHYTLLGNAKLRLGIVVLGALGLLFAGLANGLVARWLRRAAFLLSPLAAISFGQALWLAAHYDPTPYADQRCAPMLPAKPGAPRVLWIIFDELDYRRLFAARDPRLHVPEFDRFRHEAIGVDYAYPPGKDTLHSLPSLLTGHVVTAAHPSGPSDLWLDFADGTPSGLWSKQPTIFTRARQLGYNAALIGWYHPYCRILGSTVSACESWELPNQNNSVGDRYALNQPRTLFETVAHSPFPDSLTELHHERNIREMLSRADSYAIDRRFNLTFIHLPIPHDPYVPNRILHTATLGGYLGSIQLADNALGRIRTALRNAGLWDQTTILISSDHSLRTFKIEHSTTTLALPGRRLDDSDSTHDERVPFLLKRSSQRGGVSPQGTLDTYTPASFVQKQLSATLAAVPMSGPKQATH